MVMKVKNSMLGTRYGRLIAIEFLPDKTEASRYVFLCDCGNTAVILGKSVKIGKTKSCGCLNREVVKTRNIRHGHSIQGVSPTYSSWAAMMRRCEWGGTPNYYTYGAVGIRVDPTWHRFEAFLSDMGERKLGTSLDRIDNKKGYFHGNCRWATNREQATNRSNTIFVNFNGERRKVADLVVELGLGQRALINRAYRRGGDYVAALRSMGFKDVYPASPNER